MGKFIRHFTETEYNHVSLTFDPEIQTLYSFSRKHINTPFYGGFVSESLMRYQKDGCGCKLKLCVLPLKKSQENAVKQRLEYMLTHREKYIYNTFSAVCTPFGYGKLIFGAFTCIEFVWDILCNAGIIKRSGNSQCVPRIECLEKLLQKYTVFEGDSSEYIKASGWQTDTYPEKMSMTFTFAATCTMYWKLFYRWLFR